MAESADLGLQLTQEQLKIGQVESLLRAFDMLQNSFGDLTSPQERGAAEGRRCIIGISDLKHYKKAFFFEVVGSHIKLVPPYTEYTTFIAAPIDSVIRVLKGVLSGDESAFSSEWARGQCRIVGKRSIHDGLQFSEGFRRLARLVKRYQALIGTQA